MDAKPAELKVREAMMRWRFSIRALFGLTLVCALLLAWVARERAIDAAQERAIQRLDSYAPVPVGAAIEFQENRRLISIFRGLFGPRCGARVDSVAILKGPTEDRVPKDILSALHDLVDVQQLMLYNTGVNDADLADLSRITSLRRMDLTENPITNQGLRHLVKMPHLTTLALGGTSIDDEGLMILAQLRSLEYVRLSNHMLDSRDPLATGKYRDPAVTAKGLARFRELRPDVEVREPN